MLGYGSFVDIFGMYCTYNSVLCLASPLVNGSVVFEIIFNPFPAALDDDVLRYPPYVIEGREGCDPYDTKYRIRDIHYDVRNLIYQGLQKEDDD